MATPEHASTASIALHDARLSQTGAYCAAFIALGMVSASLGPTISGLAANTGTTLSRISVLFPARSIGYALGSFLGGLLYDRMRGHPIMVAVLVAMGVTMALSPVTPLLWLLVPVFLITGLAEGALDVGGNVLLVWVHRAGVGPYMNALHFFFGVGAFLSPILIAQIGLGGDQLRWAYWALAALMLPPAAWLWRVPSPKAEDGQQHASGRKASALLLALFIAFFFLYVSAEVSFGGWVFTYGVQTGLADESASAYLTSAFWGALTLGRLLAIPIATRFRPESMLLGDLIGSLASVLVILLWPASPVALWAGALGLGLCLASIFPTLMSLAEHKMAVTGSVTGWFLVASSAGGTSLPWLIGQLFEPVGPRVVMLAIAADLVATFAVWAAVALYRSGKQAPGPRTIGVTEE
jgi:FHS family Na+ dependent glucose MFS transporter 1